MPARTCPDPAGPDRSLGAPPLPLGVDRPRRAIPALPAGTVCAVSAVVAAVPLVVAALVLLAAQPVLHLENDGPIVELAVRQAAHGRQLLGPYSQFGWSHPGPLWFYLLVPVYVLGGSTTAALLASHLLIQAGFAALVVWAAGWRRPWWTAVATALAVGVFVWDLDETFAQIWNPYALPLPTALFLLLAARAAAGSAAAWGGLLLVGTFLVQTHVGMAVLVALGVLLALLGTSRRRWVRRRDGTRPAADGTGPEAGPAAGAPGRRRPRAAALLASAGGFAAAAWWVPPLGQQFRAPDGNLLRLVRFFTAPPPGLARHGAAEAVGVVSHAVGAVLALRHPVNLRDQAWSGETAGTPWHAVVVVALATLLGAVLALVGRQAGDRQLGWLGIAAALAVPGAVWAVTRVVGPIWAYVATWIFALPLVLFVGCLWAAGHARPRRSPAGGGRRADAPHLAPRGRLRPHPGAVLASVVCLGAVAAALTPTLVDASHRRGACCDSPNAAQAAAVVDAVADRTAPGSAILVRPAADRPSMWPLTTAMLLELDRRGRHGLLSDSFGRTFDLPHAPAAPVVIQLQALSDPVPPGFRVVGRLATTTYGPVVVVASGVPAVSCLTGCGTTR